MTPFLADLHIHSPYSRATSPTGTLAGLFAWARVKGISVVGSGDFTHPAWFKQLRENLEPAEPGLFRLQDEAVPPALPGIRPEAIPVRFLLSTEISCIYKRHGRVRKVHNLILAPDFAATERINIRLAKLGNLESDGRPILGLDSRDLLEIVLEASPEAFLVPAHIWTPWFSLFGSKSGFDTVEECFGDLAPHVFALETGLSSDPAMNRRISRLDRFALISNSDCHSPGKLGREVNRFATALDFFAMRDSLKNPADGGFQGTLEFFPEEGKYHSDGHRHCQVCLDPLATRELDAICPVCKRPLTIGVNHRVRELADREQPCYPAGQPGFESIVPLPEVVAELLGQGPATQKVTGLYVALINQFGSEFTLLRATPLEDLSRLSPVLGEAIRRIRTGQVIRQAGYDGEFGRITVFAAGEIASLAGQESLFTRPRRAVKTPNATQVMAPLARRRLRGPETPAATAMNPEQRRAVASEARRVLVVAGPGTGKTFTLVERIRHLVLTRGGEPGAIAAITFTRRAAREIEERLARQGIDGVMTGTFHHFCLAWLREVRPELAVAGEEDESRLLAELFPEAGDRERRRILTAIEAHGRAQNTLLAEAPEASPEVAAYLAALDRQGLIGLEQMVPAMLASMAHDQPLRARIRADVRHLLVDEFQDVNRAQYELVLALGETASLFAIGDPDQAIYGFRGSDPRLFARLGTPDDPSRDVETVTLTRNYRSGAAILSAAHALISHNQGSRKPLCPSEGAGPGRIEVQMCPTAKAEAELVVRRIEGLMGGVCHFSLNTGRGGTGEGELTFADFAVCYRLHRQAEALTEALNRRGLPLQMVGRPPFFMAGELRALYYWVQAATGAASRAEGLSLCQLAGLSPRAVAGLEARPGMRTARELFAATPNLALPAKDQARLTELTSGIPAFAEQARVAGVAAALAACLPRLGIAQGTAQRLLDLAGLFGHDLLAFGEHLRDNAGGQVYDPRAEAVSLLSLHAAKGLEFPVVFICGLEEGVIPYLPPGREADIEEERRLLYVGLTRARGHLILTAAGNQQDGALAESRFLHELPAGLIETPGLGQKGRKQRRAARQLPLF